MHKRAIVCNLQVLTKVDIKKKIIQSEKWAKDILVGNIEIILLKTLHYIFICKIEQFLLKLKIGLPYNLTIAPLGIFPSKTKTMFTQKGVHESL